MSQPDQYFPSFSFTDFQTANPSQPLPASELDSELENISLSINEICTNLAIIQRDDGQLQNGIVTADSLSSAIDPANAVASAATASAAATACQNILSSVISQWCGTAGGSANAITLTPGSPITAYAAGQKFRFLYPFTGNTSNVVTGSVSGKASISFLGHTDGQGLAANGIGIGDLQQNCIYEIEYNAVSGGFELMNQRASRRSIDVFLSGNPLVLGANQITGDIADLYNGGTCTGITLGDGQRVSLRMQAITTFQNGASLVLPNGASIIAQVGDILTFRGYPSSVVRLESWNLASGCPLSVPQGYRNGLINSNMRFNTRGVDGTASYATISSLTQTLDGWFAWGWSGGTSFTVSQQAGASDNLGIKFANLMRIQRPNSNAATNTHAVAQIIPTGDCSKFAGRRCVLSFSARSGANFSAASGQMFARVEVGTGTDEGSASLVAATWTGQSLALAQTFQTINSTLTRYSIPLSIGASVTEISVELGFVPVGTAGANDYIEISGVELSVLGSGISEYENLPYDVDLRRCKRFVRKTFPRTVAPAQSGGVTGAISVMSPAAASFGNSIDFDVPMVKTPSVTTYNPSAANANWRDTTNAADKTVTVNEVNSDRITITGASGAASALNRIHYLADAAL